MKYSPFTISSEIKLFKIVFILLFLLFSNLTFSQQANTVVNLTQNGIMDNIFDQFGKKYKLSDIKIEASKSLPNNTTSITNTTPLCTAGYFNLYFENGSGMEIVSDPTQNAINTNRRSVICQVFQDLSQFIVSDNLNIQGNKVNIWVRNINNVITSPISVNGVLGYGTSYYNVPFNNSPSFGGIADGEVWKVIHTGQDSYSGLISPLISNGSTTPSSYYHGVIAINFNTNNSPAVNWYSTPLTSYATNLYYDLYTEILREATHLLGFTSLIDINGQSKFGLGFNYYSRYDLFLKNNSNNQSIIKNNANECSYLYNYTFNSNLSTSILNPNPSSCITTTVCSNALKYGVNAIPVYTPNCFDRYSLSHFEDVCTTPAYINDAYFVMCNEPSNNGLGTNPINTKRYLKPEERNVLIDLGYSVRNVYGNPAQKSYFFYGGISPTVAHPSGINSGIQPNGEYYFYGFVNTTINLNLFIILNNQLGTTGFECMQDIYDPNATINGVNNLTMLNVSTPYLNFQSNVSGLHLLRFVPVRNQGNTIVRGNITYVYVFVQVPPPNSCNIINNGNFENNQTCGINNFSSYFSPLAYTPDLLKRNCTNNNNMLNVGVNTMNSNPPSDSYNGTPNDCFAGIYCTTNGTEALQTSLSSPLIAGNQYVLSFWAKVNNNFTSNPNLAISFSSYPNQLAYSGLLINTNFQNFASNSVSLGQPTIVPNDNSWHRYTLQFTMPSGIPNQNMIAMYLESVNGYMFIDDVFILTQAQFDTFNLPENICSNNTIPNLLTYFNPNTLTNGDLTFSGNGVTLNSSGIYSFNPLLANIGLNVISYSYSFQGCIRTFYDTINVVSYTSPTFPTIPVLCQGSTPPSLPTTSNNGITGTWSPATISTAASGNYTFTPAAGQCGNAISVAVQVLSNTAFVTNADDLPVTFWQTTAPITTNSVLLNDTYNGGAVPATIPGIPYSIVLTGTPPTIPAGSITFNATTGTFTVASNTTPGTYVYQYYLQTNCYVTPTRTIKIVVNRFTGESRIGFGFCFNNTSSTPSSNSSTRATNLFSGIRLNGIHTNGTNSIIVPVSPTTTPPPQMTQLTTNGTFTIPAGTLPGTYFFYYQICSSGFCTGTIECQIQIDRTFIANADTVTAAASGAITYNVLSNDVYRGTCSSTSIVPATTGSGGNVTLTQVAPFSSYYSILSSGVINNTLNPVPPGSYILNYNLCDNLFPAICQTVTVQITVPSPRMGNSPVSTIFDLQKITITPNPSDGNFTIYFNETIEEASLEIFTMLGQKIDGFTINNSSQYNYENSRLAKGTYLIKVSCNEETISKRIIIK